MATMDDAAFLINHIRNSFITSDDTGISELVIELDDSQAERASTGTDIRPTTWHGTRTGGDSGDSGLESDTELVHSMDIHPDMGFDSHRRRSNTAARLEKLKVEKHRQSKIKHVQWKDAGISMPDDTGELFGKKPLLPPEMMQARRGSSLSVQLEKFAEVRSNPFMEYAKFDGKTTAGIPTKKISIYLTMAPPPERSYPMLVVTLATAKVQDLIGLICWQYAQENRVPPLKAETVEAYALHIAEDDGEVDTDFPALDPKETISKFGFNQLALVEKEVQPQAGAPKSSVVVTINMLDRGFSKIPIETESVLLRELLEKVLKKRKLKQDKGRKYILEKQNEPGVVIDLDSPLSAMDTLDFCLIRENSTRGDTEIEEVHEGVSALAESLSSHQYRSYVVNLVNKIRTNTEVQLGVSGEKIEIDPVSGKGILFKQKAVTYEIESIASCVLTDQRASGRSTFRMVYLSGQDFKHHDFECDTEVAEEIVQKVNNILEMRSSPVRKDYIAHRERKLQKRHTLSFS